MTHTRPLAQVEIEERIIAVIEQLELQTEEYDDISRKAAEAEADYRKLHAMTMLGIIQHGEKMTAYERSARCELATAESHRRYLIRQAARNSRRESLLSLRDHLDALRTLNASVRAQT